MRLLHTADWHLGRLFLGRHLTEDQEHVLGQLVDLVTEEHIDVVLLAGDVYDRAVPPTEAVSLLGDVVQRIVGGAGVPMVLIAGNHDSPERLAFAAGMLSRHNLHIAGPLVADPAPVVLHDEHGPVVIHAVPYAEPAMARAVYGDDDIHDHAAALASSLQRCRAGGGRHVVVAHAFVAGGQASESERPLTIGGTGCVPSALMAGLDYVALGHLHRPQELGVPDELAVPATPARIHYAGSLLKYSFEEHAQAKSVTIVDLGPAASAPDGLAQISCRRVALTPRRDLRRLRGTLGEIIAAAQSDSRREDYIEAELQDRGALFDAMGQLRAVYPNALSLRIPEVELVAHRRSRPDPDGTGDLELFSSFLEHVSGEPLTDDEASVFVTAADRLTQNDREASP